MSTFVYENKHYKFEYDCEAGLFNINYKNQCKLNGCLSAIKDDKGKMIRNTEFCNHEIIEKGDISDNIGVGQKVVVNNYCRKDYIFKQVFYLYDEEYLTIRVELCSDNMISVNYMAPFILSGRENIAIAGQDLRSLFVPFDNDKWVRFISYPLKYAEESYEFTSIYDENAQNGLVTGSLTHDEWKTGIDVKGDKNDIDCIEVYGGAASEQTRDALPHGYLNGKKVKSPLIFIGYYDNYKTGFEAFGHINSVIKPALKWNGGVPFGWNSWAALMQTVNCNKYVMTSDFIKEKIQQNFSNDGTVYINFDACWNKFSDNELANAIQHVRNNGQKPGLYTAPFVTIESIFDKTVDGTDGKYKYRDLLLKDSEGHVLPQVDGLYSLDPTHPGTIEKIKHETQRIISLGAEYVKADFLGHAAREGNFYNKDITTGIQAYNYAMKYFTDMLSRKNTERDIFISLSIAPIFPHGYGHSRRISCDSFGTIDQTEYMLNSLTYLWWMNDCLYRYNDPDHIVLFKTYDKVATKENEAFTRFNAAVICGTVMINSDDFSYECARKRAEKILTNEEVNKIAAKGVTFVPFAGSHGDKAADIFIRRQKDVLYVALFNYGVCDEKKFAVDIKSLGLDYKEYEAEDLYTKECTTVNHTLNVTLEPAASTIIKIKCIHAA